jgi:hypothetical protein
MGDEEAGPGGKGETRKSGGGGGGETPQSDIMLLKMNAKRDRVEKKRILRKRREVRRYHIHQRASPLFFTLCTARVRGEDCTLAVAQIVDTLQVPLQKEEEREGKSLSDK